MCNITYSLYQYNCLHYRQQISSFPPLFQELMVQHNREEKTSYIYISYIHAANVPSSDVKL